MRKSLITLLLLCGVMPVFGQQASPEKLEMQLRQHPQQDTFRVNRLNELGNSFREDRVLNKRIETVANEAFSISQRISYFPGEGYALINLSWVKGQKGDRKQASALLTQANEIAEKIGDQTLLVHTLLAAGGEMQNTGELKTALFYYLKADSVAEKSGNQILLSRCQGQLGALYANSLGDLAKGMDWALKAEKNAEEANSLNMKAQAWNTIAAIYTTLGDQVNALVYYKKTLEANKTLGNKSLEYTLLNRIGEMYRLTGKYPEALKAYTDGIRKTKLPYSVELTESNMADVYVKMGNLHLAFKCAFNSLDTAKQLSDTEGIEWIESILGDAYLKEHKPDSAIFYSQDGYSKAKHTGDLEFKRDNCQALADAYVQKNDFADAYKFQNLYITYRDSMASSEVTNKTSVLQYNYDLAKKQAQIAALNQDKKLQRYFLTGALILTGLIAITVIVLYRNNRQKQKANVLLSKQKHIIEEQRDQTNKALNDLQVTQRQLIQSEKMASLGELTAGIAHEIQNPLNFVNNFSEVNMELIDEMESELSTGDKNEAITIAGNIKQNLEKIRHHGQRADGIVKGMLQHSRASSNTKEPTDINKLADEYLRLTYHGLRAKDKSFNADLVTHFDEKLPVVSLVPQDIGRAMLNLFNNGFYAVMQKQKTAGPDFKPTVELSTSEENGFIVIKVKDNGRGIPDDIKDKIMQPFFTTKPTGQGTGLGLSLSYDIIKAHGGGIDIESVKDEYAIFIIKLPLSSKIQ